MRKIFDPPIDVLCGVLATEWDPVGKIRAEPPQELRHDAVVQKRDLRPSIYFPVSATDQRKGQKEVESTHFAVSRSTCHL